MYSKFFFLLLISTISASTVSIGSCLKYSQDGQSCSQCIPNYHLYDGLCYVDILGCSQYQFGNICHQCNKNYILVNNMCCDMVCMSKIFLRFKKQVKQQIIRNNTQILSQLIPYASKQYLKDTTGRLVAIEVNDYLDAKRFFLLYQFYEPQFYSKRLIIDYIIKTQKFIIIDWTQVKNSWNYGNVQWTQIEDDASILLLYPDLYPPSQKFSEIVARKAILSEVNQYQIATRSQTSMDLVILYIKQQYQVILKKTTTKIQTIQTIISDSPSPLNQSNTKTQQHLNQSSVNTVTTSVTVTFSPYQLQYKGQDISAQLDVNEPLIICVNLVKSNEQWKKQNYAFTLVIQSAKVANVIEFTIVGQNKLTGSIIKYEVVFNKPSSQAFISTISHQQVQVKIQQIISNSTSSEPTNVQTTIQMVESKVYVVEQGIATHTIYEAPLSPQIQLIANKLKQMQVAGNKQTTSTQLNSNQTDQTPFISYVPAGLTFRRLVVSQFCQGSPYRQVAYVQANTSSKVQYFTYYFQVNDPSNTTNKTWYALGDKNKNQTQYWDTVYSRPLTQTDPSFISGPSATFSQYSTNEADFRANLTSQQQDIFDNLSPVGTTQIDRQLGSIKRFAVNYADPWNDYRAVGFKILNNITGLVGDIFAVFCPMEQATQTLFISSNGPKTNGTSSTITTTVQTDLVGDQTIKTIDVTRYLNQDQILQDSLTWLQIEKPILSSYQLAKIQISQFTQTLEYTLGFTQKNTTSNLDSPKSSITAVVVHQKANGSNQIISFQIFQSSPTGNTNPETDVHSITQTKEQYVLVDTKTSQDYNISKDSFFLAQNLTTPSVNQSSSNSSQPSSNQTSSNTTSSNQSSSSSNQTTIIQNQIKLIQEKQRLQQVLESIIQQLQSTYSLIKPSIVQVLQKIIPEQNIMKLNLIVQNHNSSPSNYSVAAIASTNNQNQPVIQSVKQITPQIVQKITPIVVSTQSPTKTNCSKTSVNSDGQEVCLDQSSSGQSNIIGGTTSTPSTTSQTANTTTQQNQTQIVQQPSKQVLTLVQQKSFQQTRQVDGQVQKIYVNPPVSGIDQSIEQIINLAVQKQQQSQSEYKTNEVIQSSKVVGIQLSATLIYTHYAITIKTIYETIITIRRYYFIRNIQPAQIIYMGYETLKYPFDLTLLQNRAFTQLKTQQITAQTSKTYQNIVSIVNKKSTTIYYIIHIITIKYRTFPSGQYQRITLKNQNTVANAHIIISNGSTTVLNLNEVPITQITSQPTTSEPTNTNTQTTQTNSSQIINPTNPTTTTGTNDNSTPPNQTLTDTTPNVSDTTPKVVTDVQPEEILTQQQQIPVENVVLSQKLQFDLRQVLQYLSVHKADQLAGSSLEQYAITQDKSVDGTVTSIKFDLYFAKQVSQTLIKEYLCSVVKHQTTNEIEITIFLTNDIDTSKIITQQLIKNQTINPFENTTISNGTIISNGTSGTQPSQTISTSISSQIIKQQINLNSNFVIVDPNSINYPEGMSFVQQDPTKQDFDVKVDLKNIPLAVEQTIKYLRGKYSVIYRSSILAVISSTKTTTVQRFRIYFFKQLLIGDYQIYRAIVEYSVQTPQKRFNIISFQLYAAHHQMVLQPARVADQSLKDDTDLAYGFINLDLESVSKNQNIQTVIQYINTKYRDILINKKIAKIEELKLFDGRVNYKIIFKDTTDNSQFKFIVFYQPLLKKVLVLNSVNLPHHSQYNQLSSDQQKSDTLFNSALSYLNQIHPQISGFNLRSVSKSNQNTYTEYQIVIQKNNKKYKSLIRIASNNVDITQISFSQIVQLSLDHYRLDQFDQMFIMNYQKLSQQELRSNSQVRIVLNFLHTNQQITDSELLGVAYKPSGLGFLYKVYLLIGSQKILTIGQVYIESFSDKITLKSYKSTDFDSNFIQISTQQTAVSKIISFIKQKTSYTQITVKSAFAKDFLYGNLYKLNLGTNQGNKALFIYHDHSTQEINILFTRGNEPQDQCLYEGLTCKQCKDINYRVANNKCVQKIQNCQNYSEQICSQCNSDSQIVNKVCILKSECGVLCQVVSM